MEQNMLPHHPFDLTHSHSPQPRNLKERKKKRITLLVFSKKKTSLLECPTTSTERSKAARCKIFYGAFTYTTIATETSYKAQHQLVQCVYCVRNRLGSWIGSILQESRINHGIIVFYVYGIIIFKLGKIFSSLVRILFSFFLPCLVYILRQVVLELY